MGRKIDPEPSPLVTKSNEKWSGDVFGDSNFEKSKDDFHWVGSDEPHRSRRKMILKDHPEIRELFGHEPLTAVVVIALTAAQLWVASWITEASWPVFLITMYAFGGTVNHTLQLANHEISHNLCFGQNHITANKLMGIVANFVTGVPSSVTFRFYHYEHHMYQGVEGVDTDIPTTYEIALFKGTFLKIIWCLLQPFFYALRPVIVKPRPITPWMAFNGIAQLAFNYWVIQTYGWGALGYMIGGSLIGMGIHPCAGHFIAEHYEFMKGYETYSYYGSCNYFNLFVGYHNEHHDFPKVPWSRLHKVKEIAPEYYDNLPHHTSYIRVIWNFITDPEIGSWSRVKRLDKKKQ